MKAHGLAIVSGFMVGILASVLYLLFGSWSLFSPAPLWAQIVFFPGVLAGHSLYQAGLHSQGACTAAGAFVMGLVGALIGCAASLPFRAKE